MAVLSFWQFLKGRLVVFCMDNEDAVFNLESTNGRSTQMKELLQEIHSLMEQAEILSWEAEFIAGLAPIERTYKKILCNIQGQKNKIANKLSKTIDTDDWRLNPTVFHELDSLWGPHTVDRMADDQNKHIQRFNSKWWCPGSPS